MKIPTIKTSEDKFYLQLISIINPFLWNLSNKQIKFYSLILKEYNSLKKETPLTHKELSDEILKNPLEFAKKYNINKNVLNRFINDLIEKGLIKDNILIELFCFNKDNDNELIFKWEVNG